MDWKSIKIETMLDRLLYADWLEEQGESESLVNIIRQSVDWKIKRTTQYYRAKFLGPPKGESQCVVMPWGTGKTYIELFYGDPIGFEHFIIDDGGFSLDNDKNWTWLLGYLK